MHWKIACFPQVLLYVAVGFSLFAAEKKLANCTHTQNFFSVLFPFYNGFTFTKMLNLNFDDSKMRINFLKSHIIFIFWFCIIGQQEIFKCIFFLELSFTPRTGQGVLDRSLHQDRHVWHLIELFKAGRRLR